MFKDEHRDNVWQQLRQRGLQAFAAILTPQAAQAAAQAAGVRIGTSALNAPTMAWLGIVSALYATKNFAGVLGITLKLLDDCRCDPPKSSRKRPKKKQDKRSKHDPRGTVPKISEEAFVQGTTNH